MTNEDHPTTKSDAKPYEHPYEEPKKKDLSGSLTTDEVTIIGNDPRQMRDLTVNPDDGVDIQGKVRKRKLRLERKRQIDNAYNKRFSMFKDTKTAVSWISLALLMFGILLYVLNSLGGLR